MRREALRSGFSVAAFVAVLAVPFLYTPSASSADAVLADAVVIVSADAEWTPVREFLSHLPAGISPFGEFITAEVAAAGKKRAVVYLHGGWGKISAAASAQYAIDRWRPALLVNLGTCGGFEGRVKPSDVLLVRKTVVYDIYELMGDAREAIADYSTTLDLAWLKTPYPVLVVEAVMVSADRDLRPEDIAGLARTYAAVAADWESGAIAYTAKRNRVPCLILRAVSDIVGRSGSDVYGNLDLFRERAARLMKSLINGLPRWLDAANAAFSR